MTKLVWIPRERASQVGTNLITHFTRAILHSHKTLEHCSPNWPIDSENIIIMKTLKHFSLQKWKMRLGKREKKVSECEEKGTQTESELVKTQENFIDRCKDLNLQDKIVLINYLSLEFLTLFIQFVR